LDERQKGSGSTWNIARPGERKTTPFD